jgi:hypothetical protein
MGLRTYMRRLGGRRAAVSASALLALLGAILSVSQINLLPPRLTPRSLELAAASTQVVVDNPGAAAVDFHQGSPELEALRNRALLVGNVIASAPVRQYIARRAHLAPGVLRIVPPRTPAEPRPLAEAGNKKRASDLFRSTNQYRLDIQADPTVPVLDVLAQAPTAAAAASLANAAVDGARDYLKDLAVSERTPEMSQVRLTQLGRANGGVINNGVARQVALLSFMAVFAVSCTAFALLGRVRRGWIFAGDSETAIR